MPELRYRWNARPASRSPLPPGGGPTEPAEVHILAGPQIWSRDAAEPLAIWARWCALRAVERHWPGCPAEVVGYLASGDRQLQQVAEAETSRRRNHVQHNAFGLAVWAAWNACVAERLAFSYSSSVWATHWAREAERERTGIVVEEIAQTDYLRTLLLRQVLPRERWHLIDSDEPGAEAVLIDALLGSQLTR